jgi:ABC-2 type transport system permease protein
MNLRRTKAIARKETIQILRDPRSLIMGIAIPIMLLLLFGFALTFDVDQVETVVLDRDRTQLSGDFVDRFGSSHYFKIKDYVSSEEALQKMIDAGKAQMGIVIPHDFSKRINEEGVIPVQIILDGYDSNTANIIQGYAAGLVQLFSLELFRKPQYRQSVKRNLPSVDAQTRVWFNTDLESKNAIVPGLIAVIMMVIGALLTSLTIAREWERGTMEQLISTPIKNTELILGKLSPYFIIGFLDVSISVILGQFVFKIPLRGNPLLVFGASSIFLIGALGLGFLISVVARSQFLATQMAMVITFLPAFLLSGFISPISQMPKAIQIVTYLIPARYFVAILKGIYMKGIGMNIIWVEGIFLVLFGFIILMISNRKFRKKLV